MSRDSWQIFQSPQVPGKNLLFWKACCNVLLLHLPVWAITNDYWTYATAPEKRKRGSRARQSPRNNTRVQTSRTLVPKKEEMTFFGLKLVNAGNLFVCWVKVYIHLRCNVAFFSVKGSNSLVRIHSEKSGKFALKHLSFGSTLQTIRSANRDFQKFLSKCRRLTIL